MGQLLKVALISGPPTPRRKTMPETGVTSHYTGTCTGASNRHQGIKTVVTNRIWLM